MKTIKHLSQAIDEKRIQIARVEEDLARAQSVASLSTAGEYELSELQRCRCEILGAAFIAKVEPDTSPIDRQIEVHEATIRVSRQNAEAARAAQVPLQLQLAALQAEEGALAEQRRQRMLADLRVGYAAGQKPYVEFVDGRWEGLRAYLVNILQQVGTTAGMIETVCERMYTHYANSGISERFVAPAVAFPEECIPEFDAAFKSMAAYYERTNANLLYTLLELEVFLCEQQERQP